MLCVSGLQSGYDSVVQLSVMFQVTCGNAQCNSSYAFITSVVALFPILIKSYSFDVSFQVCSLLHLHFKFSNDVP